jgi:hypothetical protein
MRSVAARGFGVSASVMRPISPYLKAPPLAHGVSNQADRRKTEADRFGYLAFETISQGRANPSMCDGLFSDRKSQCHYFC